MVSTQVARGINEKMSNNKNRILVEGKDYYISNGKYVFTASFLKERGYCCSNGCRHCPYPKKSD